MWLPEDLTHIICLGSEAVLFQSLAQCPNTFSKITSVNKQKKRRKKKKRVSGAMIFASIRKMDTALS